MELKVQTAICISFFREVDFMMLDKNAIERLLSLDDASLTAVIRQLAASAGVNTANLNFGKTELENIRRALSLATEGDTSLALNIIKNFKKQSGT